MPSNPRKYQDPGAPYGANMPGSKLGGGPSIEQSPYNPAMMGMRHPN